MNSETVKEIEVGQVYACVKNDKDGPKNKYVDLGTLPLKPGGKSINEILKAKDETIEALQRQINAIVKKLGLTSELAVLTAESRGNEE